MRRALVAAVCAALVCASTAAASNSVVFTDSAGEDPASPDIGTVKVTNNDSSLITFFVNTASPVLIPGGSLRLFLDTDGNASTGGPGGAEYQIFTTYIGAALLRWNGTAFAISPPGSLVKTATGNTTAISINAADLGGAKTFNFWLLAVTGVVADENGQPSYAQAHSDPAPDSGSWNYKVIVAPPKPQAGPTEFVMPKVRFLPKAKASPAKATVAKCKPGQRSTPQKPCRP